MPCDKKIKQTNKQRIKQTKITIDWATFATTDFMTKCEGIQNSIHKNKSRLWKNNLQVTWSQTCSETEFYLFFLSTSTRIQQSQQGEIKF